MCDKNLRRGERREEMYRWARVAEAEHEKHKI